MKPLIYVGIAEYRLLDEPGTLACSALGSCVAVCLWDPDSKLSGLLHLLLPHSEDSLLRDNPAKFADRGVPLLVRAMEQQGVDRRRLQAKMVGGANLYVYEYAHPASEIGTRNARAARAALESLHIPILAEEVGGETGRSLHFDHDTFTLRVIILSKGEVTI